MMKRNQEELYRKLRHDLLNKVEIISLMEQNANR